jgi:YegS/Rv2252/BmrU family lipid kinase
MRAILFVINPISGGISKKTLKEDICQLLDGNDLSVDFFETTGKDDPERLARKVSETSPDQVVACGGDGTINLVSSVIIDLDIVLGILPMGSANGLATELGIPANIRQALTIIRNNQTRKIDVLMINDQYLSLHLADLGFNAKLIKRFEQAGKRGKMGYARQFIRTLMTQESVRYYFQMNDHTFSRRAQMVTFANARKYGTGAVVNPDGQLDDGLFEVCIFRPYPWYALLGIMLRFFTGSLKKSKYVKIHSTNKVSVHSRKPEMLQVDGEAVGEYKEVDVKIHPCKIPVLTNKKTL